MASKYTNITDVITDYKQDILKLNVNKYKQGHF